MVEFLSWFQTNYPHLKNAMQRCQHNLDDKEINPYHIEGDCWSHTMMVCKIAELKGYDRVVQVASLLHDIGKPKSRRVNPRNGHVQFFGHEELSAKMAKPLLNDLIARDMLLVDEAKEVEEIIALHGEIYKDRKGVEEKLKNKPSWLKHLLELHQCDDLGRFKK
jgi:putative nucleotidyltransferase with HDIG domain